MTEQERRTSKDEQDNEHNKPEDQVEDLELELGDAAQVKGGIGALSLIISS